MEAYLVLFLLAAFGLELPPPTVKVLQKETVLVTNHQSVTPPWLSEFLLH